MSEYFVLFTPEGKGIYGELDDAGVVAFAVDAGPGSSVRGTELFNRMMDHFGAAAKAVHGMWRIGPLKTPSTNLDKVNELTGMGMPLEDAILHAWTVTRARKRGLGKVKVLGTPVGSAGCYTEVDVLIER